MQRVRLIIGSLLVMQNYFLQLTNADEDCGAVKTGLKVKQKDRLRCTEKGISVIFFVGLQYFCNLIVSKELLLLNWL